MINLSLDELRLIAQSRNIRDYENKSEKDLLRALSDPKSKPKIRNNKRQLEKTRKDFNKLRHKFSKNEADNYRKAFYVIKIYRHLSTSEIEDARKNLVEIRKSLRFEKFHGNMMTLIMMTLIVMMINVILPMKMNTEKLGALEHYLKNLIEIITNQ